MFFFLNIQLRVSFSFVGEQIVSYTGFSCSRTCFAGGHLVIIVVPLPLKFKRVHCFLANPTHLVKPMLSHAFGVIKIIQCVKTKSFLYDLQSPCSMCGPLLRSAHVSLASVLFLLKKPKPNCIKYPGRQIVFNLPKPKLSKSDCYDDTELQNMD